MKSIRASLLVGLLTGFTLLLSGGGIALYLSVRAALLREFDNALQAKAQALATLTDRTGEEIEFEFARENMPEFEVGPHPAYFQLWRPDGQLLDRSPSLQGGDLPRHAVNIGAPAFWNLALPNGSRGRAAGMAFVPLVEGNDTAGAEATKSSPPATVVVAAERTQLDHQLGAIVASTAFVALVMMAGAAVLALIIIRRALRPLAQLAENVGGINAGTLDSRFPSDQLPAELKPICGRLNELLSRLEKAFERERRFSADVAHELRTPVAELRTLAEVAVKWPAGNVETREALSDTLEIAEQMEGIVNGLLVMARCESGIEKVRRDAIPLEALVQDVWRPFAARAERKSLAVQIDLPDASFVEGDRSLLRVMLSNFLSNAVEYTPDHGEISIDALSNDETSITLRIANTAPDLEPSDLEHVFERFWRKETARTSSLRAGLGLSISQAVSQMLGIPLRADVLNSKTFVITVTLPSGSAVSV